VDSLHALADQVRSNPDVKASGRTVLLNLADAFEACLTTLNSSISDGTNRIRDLCHGIRDDVDNLASAIASDEPVAKKTPVPHHASHAEASKK